MTVFTNSQEIAWTFEVMIFAFIYCTIGREFLFLRLIEPMCFLNLG